MTSFPLRILLYVYHLQVRYKNFMTTGETLTDIGLVGRLRSLLLPHSVILLQLFNYTFFTHLFTNDLVRLLPGCCADYCTPPFRRTS